MSAPVISDHALLRFLERGAGCDVEVLRAQLSASLRRAHLAARSMGGSDHLIKIDGLTFVVRGETVTTVLPSGTASHDAHAMNNVAGRRKK